MASWKTKSSKVVYENPWMIVHEDKVVRPDGMDGLYGYVDSTDDAVYIVPVDSEGNTYIVLQERYAIKRMSWECPAGRIDKGESVETAARRELIEETGLEAESIIPIGEVQEANGIATFKSTFCIARGINHITDNLDQEDGILGVKKVSLSEVSKKILAGEITCCASIAAFYMTIAYLEKEKAI